MCVVVPKPSAKLGLLGRERYAPVPGMPNAFFLDGAVKAFNVGIVIGAVEPTVSGWYVVLLHDLFKVASVLGTIVCLHYGDCEAPCSLGF